MSIFLENEEQELKDHSFLVRVLLVGVGVGDGSSGLGWGESSRVGIKLFWDGLFSSFSFFICRIFVFVIGIDISVGP